jgi:hypothetical protein
VVCRISYTTGTLLRIDDATGDVMTLSAQSGLLRIYNAQLSLTNTVQLPPAVLAGSGNVSIDVHGSFLYVHRDGQSTVSLVTIPASPATTEVAVSYVELGGATGSKGLAVDDSGRIFLQSAAGTLAEYRPSGQLLSGSPFTGQTVGSQFVVTTSYSNPYSGSIPFDTPIPESPIPTCHGTKCS